MPNFFIKKQSKNSLPIMIEQDEDGLYVAECPVFRGCYSQGKTLSEVLVNIKEVIGLCLEDRQRITAENFARCGNFRGRI